MLFRSHRRKVQFVLQDPGGALNPRQNVFDAVAEGAGLTLAQLALAWVLRQPNVAAAIVGASRPEQLEDNAAASGVVLSKETLAAVDAAVAGVVVQPG